MRGIILSVLLFNSALFSNIGPQGFKKWLNPYFVETGTAWGNGLQRAINEGFTELHSLELIEQKYHYCSMRFMHNKNVHLYNKNSGTELWDVIRDLPGPITFWLDGHRGKPDPLGGKNTPLLEELDQIKLHPYKKHTILIDDLHCAGGILFDFITVDQILRKIWEINPEYKFIFEDGGDEGEYKNNILVAFIEQE